MATNGNKLLTFTTLILLLALLAARDTRAAAAHRLSVYIGNHGIALDGEGKRRFR